jgi:hypothetical protein
VGCRRAEEKTAKYDSYFTPDSSPDLGAYGGYATTAGTKAARNYLEATKNTKRLAKKEVTGEWPVKPQNNIFD